MLQVNTMVLIIMVVLVTYQVHADPTISTSTPTPCYGDVVTLVCHHPEVVSNPGRYFGTGPAWRENGVGITPSTGVYLQADTSEDLTRTTLPITITVDHFRNKSFNYSCLLVLAENGLPTGEVETSGNVTVDPVEKPYSPVIASLPSSSSNLTKWTHDRSCYSHHTFGFILTWTKMVDPPDPPSSGSNMTTATRYDFSSLPRGEYSVSIRAQCMENTSIESDVTSARISLTAPVMFPLRNATAPPPTDPPVDSTVLIIIAVVVVVVSIAILALIIVGFICICVCCKKSKTPPSEEVDSKHQPSGPSEGTFGQDEKNSTTPFYANVEMDDGSVPMTTNPSYGQIELSGIHNKPIYANL